MTTIMKIARSGSITDEMKIVARQEGLSPEIIRNRVARGKIIIPHNRDNIKIIGIGEGLSTKVNVNIGTSTLVVNPKMELEK
ncbi:MAG: phosphomethylpyrimidine synthase ThiC, partial [Thermoprotei archaeon]|nr:phosphomethylpyrimidine synthase ThiC [Thermoprotei archaeon]